MLVLTLRQLFIIVDVLEIDNFLYTFSHVGIFNPACYLCTSSSFFLHQQSLSGNRFWKHLLLSNQNLIFEEQLSTCYMDFIFDTDKAQIYSADTYRRRYQVHKDVPIPLFKGTVS